MRRCKAVREDIDGRILIHFTVVAVAVAVAIAAAIAVALAAASPRVLTAI